jgi:uncharacterized membrane protein
MKSLTKKFYTPRTFDVLFAIAGLLSVAALARVAGLPAEAIAPATSPVAKAAAAIATLFAAALLATWAARFDQKMADDFLFHTLTKSAYVAMATIFIVFTFWQLLFAGSLGGLGGRAMIATACAAWSLGYFYVRIRGTAA